MNDTTAPTTTSTDQPQQPATHTGHPGTDEFLDAISRVKPFCATERVQPTS